MACQQSGSSHHPSPAIYRISAQGLGEVTSVRGLHCGVELARVYCYGSPRDYGRSRELNGRGGVAQP